MGTRSMNALLIKASHNPSAEALKFLADAGLEPRDGFKAYVWETNIAPFCSRTSIADLQEEVAILGWLLTLPEADFHLARVGADDGYLGNLECAVFDDVPEINSILLQAITMKF